MKCIFLVAILLCHTSFVNSQINTKELLPQHILKNNNHTYAVIAGGSKGIGYAIAEALAKRGYNLVLIARHMDSLLSAKQKLENKYNIHVELLSKDLSREESAYEIASWCIEKNLPVNILCNVAGYGGSNDYLSVSLDTIQYMIRLNIGSAMSLSMKLLPLLEKNAPSFILNVASMAGFAPIPSKNVYSATKSAVIFFSYSLRAQLKEKNISVSCLSPGPVFTKPSVIKDTKENLGWFGMKMEMNPKRVGEIAVRKTLHGRMMIIPGTLASLTAAVIRVLPRKVIVSIYERAGKRKQSRTATK